MEESRPQHIVNPFLRDMDLRSCIQLLLPEGLALRVKVFVRPLGQGLRPVGADGPVRKVIIHVQGLARLQENRRLFVRHGLAAEAADAEDPAFLECGETGGWIVGVLGLGEGGIGDLHPGIARDVPSVGDGRADDQDCLFIRRRCRCKDFFQLLALRIGPDTAAGIAVRDHEVRPLDVFLHEDGLFKRDETLRPVDDFVVHDFREIDWQGAVLQSAGDIVVGPDTAAETVVVADLMRGYAWFGERAAGHRRYDPLVGLVVRHCVRKLFTDLEPADVAADAQPDRTAHVPGDLFRLFERCFISLLDPVHLGNKVTGADERDHLVVGHGKAVRQHHDLELGDPDRGLRIDVAQEEGEGLRAMGDRDDSGAWPRARDGILDIAADPYAGRLSGLEGASLDAAFALQDGHARY